MTYYFETHLQIAVPSYLLQNLQLHIFISNMENHDNEICNNQPRLDELISLSQATEISGLSPSQIRLLVSKGVIWGMKLGRNWFTTNQAVKDYLKIDRRPGPKPKKRH